MRDPPLTIARASVTGRKCEVVARGVAPDYVPRVVRKVSAKKRPTSVALTRTAYHEAGHAVLSAAINDTPKHVSIRENEGTLGRSVQMMAVRPSSLAQVYLAGFAAEHLLTGRRPPQYGREVGLAILATSDAALRAAFAELEHSDGAGAVEQVLRFGCAPTEDLLRREVDRFYEISRESLTKVWSSVERLAKALLEHEELDGEAINGAMGDVDVFSPVLAVQRAHGLLLVPVAAHPAPVSRPARP